MGFTKLDEGIVHSSVWSEALATRVLWVTMLAMADSRGFVSSSRSGLLRAANIPLADFDISIDILESPDVDSRSPEYDGRRIQKCDGGWMVLNYLRYREFTYSGSKEAIKKRKQRDKRGHEVDMSPNGGDISASASAICLLSSEDLRGGVGEGDLESRRAAAESEIRREKVEEGMDGFALEGEVERLMKLWDANRIRADRLKKERLAG